MLIILYFTGFLSFLTGVVIGLLYYFLPKATSSVFLMEPVEEEDDTSNPEEIGPLEIETVYHLPSLIIYNPTSILF